MDYKALYGLVFAPILLSLVYMSYLHFTKDPTKEDTNLQPKIEDMLPLEQNFQQVNLNTFQELLAQEDTILIDVRKKSEQEEYGVVSENQLHIEFGTEEFASQILELDKTKKYLIYCWHGVRSTATRELMQENGFIWAKDLEGGIDTWNKG